MGIPGIGHRHDSVADRDQHILLLHDRPSDACVECVDGRTRRRQFRSGAARPWPQGRTRRGRRRRREIQGRLGAEGPRRGGSQDQAGPDRGPAAQGRDGQARRFLRGRRRRDRRNRVVRFDRTRSVRRHADVDRRARAGSDDHGRGGFGRSDHQRAVGSFGDGRAVLLGQRDQPSGPGIGADGQRGRRAGPHDQ